MEISALLIHAVIFLAFAVFFYSRLIRAQRLRSIYGLYKVRDDLVYLVASDVVAETDPVFTFYYKRVNAILSMAPNVGIDDILHNMLTSGNDIERALAKAKKDVDRVLAHETAQKKEVSEIIERYYKGVKVMMLSHSSIFRAFYLFAKHVNPLRIEYVLPKSFVGAYKVTKFAEREACELHHKYAHSH